MRCAILASDRAGLVTRIVGHQQFGTIRGLWLNVRSRCVKRSVVNVRQIHIDDRGATDSRRDARGRSRFDSGGLLAALQHRMPVVLDERAADD